MGAGGFDAQNGFDLLSTIVHEIGHVLGVNVEPGDFNIDPQHIGGVQDVLVLENNGHLGGNATTPGFLMCDSCGTIGVRRLPTATDVLVIAEDQGLSAVHLDRVASIYSGSWSSANGWIGGAVPDITQDVDIRHGGTIELDADAQAKNLLVDSSNSLAVQGFHFTSNGTLTFNGTSATVSVASGGTIAANSMIGDPGSLVTTAGSTVRFNQLTGNTSTTASFNGSLAIGYNSGSAGSVTYDPSLNAPTPISTWDIAENLTVGDENNATLVVNGTTWNVTGNVTVGGGPGTLRIQGTPSANGIMNVGGSVEVHGGDGGFSEIRVNASAQLNATGHIIAGQRGIVTFKDILAPNNTYDIQGGATSVSGGPTPAAYFFAYATGGTLVFEGSAVVGSSTINVDGGVGSDAPNGVVTFQNSSHAVGTMFHTKGGRRGPYSPYLCCLEDAGNGGQVLFEGGSNAGNATFINDGVTDFRYGTGGNTVFADTSSAHTATIENHGATYNQGGGGATYFRDSSAAFFANITNYADATFVYFPMSGQTVFSDSSNAGHAMIENQSGPDPFNAPGRTEFRNSSSAANATIQNRGNPTFGGGAGGGTEFYDTATAADAIINLYEGYDKSGRTDFYNQSTAANSQITIVNTDPPGGSSNGGGGHLIFHDDSTADHAQITLNAQACCNGVQFKDHATAANATIIQSDGSGRITFSENATAGNATLSSEGDNEITFFNESTAANATIAMAYKAKLLFTQNASAGQSQIEISGAVRTGTFNLSGIKFNVNSTAADSTITANGGSAAARSALEFRSSTARTPAMRRSLPRVESTAVQARL